MTEKRGTQDKEDVPWSKADTKVIRDNWGKLSTTAIGKLCKPERSKHSVISKAHRLKLPDLGNPAGKSLANPSIKKQAAEPLPPAPPVAAPPTEEDIAWKIWVHWEPGDPASWETRTHESESYRTSVAAVLAWYRDRETAAAS